MTKDQMLQMMAYVWVALKLVTPERTELFIQLLTEDEEVVREAYQKEIEPIRVALKVLNLFDDEQEEFVEWLTDEPVGGAV